MAKKDISPTRLTSVRTSFNAMELALVNSAGSFIKSDVTDTIDNGTTNIKNMTTGLIDTVDSLDAYLNAVAEAFSKTDKDLATNIQEGTKVFEMNTSEKDRYIRSKNEEIRNSQSYRYLT